MKLFIAYANNSVAPIVVGVFSTSAKASQAMTDGMEEAKVGVRQIQECEPR